MFRFHPYSSFHVIIGRNGGNFPGQKSITLLRRWQPPVFVREVTPRLTFEEPAPLIIRPARFSVRDFGNNLHVSFFWLFLFIFAISLSFCPDGCLEPVNRPVILPFRPVHGSRGQFGIGHGIEVHHFGRGHVAVRICQFHFCRIFLHFEYSLQSFDFKCHNFFVFIRFNNIPFPFAPDLSSGILPGSQDIRHKGPPGGVPCHIRHPCQSCTSQPLAFAGIVPGHDIQICF